MFEFMDGIVEVVEEITEIAGVVAAWILVGLIKAVIIITTPVWLLPYTSWRKGRK